MVSGDITSVRNETGGGPALRKAAAIAEAAIKKSARFSTASVNDLVSWQQDYEYESQDEKHKQMVDEFHRFTLIRESIDSVDSAPIAPSFVDCDTEFKNKSTRRLAELHGLISHSLWTVLIPYYVRERTKLGTRGKHWRPLESTSPLREQRQANYKLVESLSASDYVTGAPAVPLLDYYNLRLDGDDERLRYLLDRDFSVEGEYAEAGGTSTHTLRGIASTYVRVMWVALVVLGREPHAMSAIRPLTAKEWHVLVKGHDVPEDLLTGTRITPPVKYGDLVKGKQGFVACKEWTFLVAITNDAFYSDIFLPQVFFAIRARKMALACTDPETDQDFICREIHGSSSDTTIASFSNNLASVFGALKRSGADRYKPDAMDVAAIRAYGIDTSALETSGLALTYSVRKYIDIFNQDFLCARRHVRANVTVSRALDRGGMNSKKSGGRITEDSEGLREMVQALLSRVWKPTWTSVVQPWLRHLSLPADAATFLNTTDTADLVQFASSRGFSRADAERLQLLLMLHLSVFRSQVWRDAVVDEFQLVRRDNSAFYTFSLSRVFKTATAKTDGVPQLTSWQLSHTESLLVHATMLLCRPLLATGAKATKRVFLDSSGAPVTQRWIEARTADIGKEWLGIPRMGPHSLRTMWLSWLINNGLVAEQDFDNLAAYVQVSRCTMLESYVTPSLAGPSQRVGALLRDGGGGAGHVAEMESCEATESKTATAQEDASSAKGPYGKALNSKRKPYREQALAVVNAHGGDSKVAFEYLVAKRKTGTLASGELFFRQDVTYFKDDDIRPWKRLCKGE
jgi:hypothetical protein